MDAADTSRAMAAAKSIACAQGLRADGAVVLHNSNKLALRLSPCDVFARVAPLGQEVAEFEVQLARQLAKTGGPVAALDPRVEPRPYHRDGFVITLWTYYRPLAPAELAPGEYANALRRLHGEMRKLDLAAPHFTDRIAEAQRVVMNRDQSRALSEPDRELLADSLSKLTRAIIDRGSAEQLLHGEPHPGNLLRTGAGPLFIDLETCCRGPVEFDLAHAPAKVADHYPHVDLEVLSACRGLILAMVAAWRFEPGDQFPNGSTAARVLIGALREGPPWPALDVVTQRMAAP